MAFRARGKRMTSIQHGKLASCLDRTAVRQTVLVVIWPSVENLGDLSMQTIGSILALGCLPKSIEAPVRSQPRAISVHPPGQPAARTCLFAPRERACRIIPQTQSVSKAPG